MWWARGETGADRLHVLEVWPESRAEAESHACERRMMTAARTKIQVGLVVLADEQVHPDRSASPIGRPAAWALPSFDAGATVAQHTAVEQGSRALGSRSSWCSRRSARIRHFDVSLPGLGSGFKNILISNFNYPMRTCAQSPRNLVPRET